VCVYVCVRARARGCTSSQGSSEGLGGIVGLTFCPALTVRVAAWVQGIVNYTISMVGGTEGGLINHTTDHKSFHGDQEVSQSMARRTFPVTHVDARSTHS
jgi:hypothetical protein